MKWFVVFVCCVELALSLPQGYNYKEPAPAPLSGPGGFKPILSSGVPCNNGPNAAALVQHQSVGRIINQGGPIVTAGGSGLDSQAVTVNSHIVVGDGGHSQVFREGQGYADQGRLQSASLSLPQGPPLPAPGPPKAFVQTAQQQFGSSQYSSSSSYNNINNGAIINGIGKVPPPPQALSGGYQYASGFGGSKFSNVGVGRPLRGPSFLGAPINPNFIAGGGQKFGGGLQASGSKFQSGGSFQSGSSYQNSGSFQSGGSLQGLGGGSLQGLGGGSLQGLGGASQFHSGGSIGFGQQQSGGFGSAGGIGSIGHSSNINGNAILNGPLGNVIRETFANAPLDPTVEKHIYVHVPPEDLEEKEARQPIRLPEAPAKKHYKIIFIKAPTVSQQTNYAQIANAAGVSEEKTIVYVLVKKPEEPSIGEIQQIQQSIKPSKPEVYFIKYKTRKEEGPGGLFVGGGGSQQVDQIGNGPFVGSDIDSGVDIRLSGAGSGIDSTQSDVSYASSVSSSSSGSSYSSGNVNIGDGSGTPHAVYGVPNVK